MNRIIAIDQSTSSTKALLFDEQCRLVARTNVDHQQHYPQTGWVEHDAVEIYDNMIEAIRQLMANSQEPVADTLYSLAITNQRETAVVWNKRTGKPIANAVVWQDTRGAELCRELRALGYGKLVMDKSGLLIDPNFSATGIKWLLDNIPGARETANDGELLLGTIDTWLVWKLTGGKVHATDYTNASRTMLFNIHTMQWDDELLQLFDIPRSMLPEVKPCDALYGETTAEGIFPTPITIAGVLGDSHGALVGQMCFQEGSGKVTYGTGSSVMVNIGEKPLPAPEGLVTSVGYSAFGKTYYGYEGNIYSTGATLKWMADQLQLVGHPAEMEAQAVSVSDNGGVYIVPAFSGLGAPWWQSDVKGAVFGLTFATTKAHFLRAALESIAYQIRDLVDVMAHATGGQLKEICADGGPTKNKFLMQFQADMLDTPVVCTEVDDASALGAVIMNGFARGLWKSFDEVKDFRKVTQVFKPQPTAATAQLYQGWREAVGQLIK
ncbi:MAG: glycerol kinase GlpK [Prevotella sp.]|nr:glycerol kinase GlpK [Prevotella sp.]MBP3258379.1 glycerol kinase GlpK [Bacteroidales bacterium]